VPILERSSLAKIVPIYEEGNQAKINEFLEI
jgi:hypothetical protein